MHFVLHNVSENDPTLTIGKEALGAVLFLFSNHIIKESTEATFK